MVIFTGILAYLFGLLKREIFISIVVPVFLDHLYVIKAFIILAVVAN